MLVSTIPTNFNNAVCVWGVRCWGFVKEHVLHKKGLDGVRKRVDFVETRKVINHHRVDVGEVREDVSWRNGEHVWIHFESERCNLTAL